MIYRPSNLDQYSQRALKPQHNTVYKAQCAAYSDNQSTWRIKPFNPVKETVYKPIRSVGFIYDPAIRVREIQLKGASLHMPKKASNDNRCHQVFIKCEVRNEAKNVAVRFMRFGMLRDLIGEIIDFKHMMLSSIAKFKKFWKKRYDEE